MSPIRLEKKIVLASILTYIPEIYSEYIAVQIEFSQGWRHRAKLVTLEQST